MFVKSEYKTRKYKCHEKTNLTTYIVYLFINDTDTSFPTITLTACIVQVSVVAISNYELYQLMMFKYYCQFVWSQKYFINFLILQYINCVFIKTLSRITIH